MVVNVWVFEADAVCSLERGVVDELTGRIHAVRNVFEVHDSEIAVTGNEHRAR